MRRNYFRYTAIAVVILGVCSLSLIWSEKHPTGLDSLTSDKTLSVDNFQMCLKKVPVMLL